MGAASYHVTSSFSTCTVNLLCHGIELGDYSILCMIEVLLDELLLYFM